MCTSAGVSQSAVRDPRNRAVLRVGPQGPPGACCGSVTAEPGRQAQPAPPPPTRRPRTFFAAHDRGASSVCSRRDRSRRASSAKSRRRTRTETVGDSADNPGRSRPPPEAEPSRSLSRELSPPRNPLGRAHFRSVSPASQWACRRARSCSSARFRSRSPRAPCAAHTSGLCPGFSHIHVLSGALPQPHMLPVCQAVMRAVAYPPMLCSPGAGSGWSSAGRRASDPHASE